MVKGKRARPRTVQLEEGPRKRRKIAENEDDDRLGGRCNAEKRVDDGSTNFAAIKQQRKRTIGDDEVHIQVKMTVGELRARAKGGSHFSLLMSRGDDQFAQTPLSVLEYIERRFGSITFDPCPMQRPKIWNGCHTFSEWGVDSGATAKKKAVTAMVKRWKQAGLKGKDLKYQPVNKNGEHFVSYVNPPYDTISGFIEKAVEEKKKGITSVFLIPWRPFTNYWWNIRKEVSWTDFVAKGVRFRGYKNMLPVPMCMMVFLGDGIKEVPRMHWQADEEVKNMYIYNVPFPQTWVRCVQEVGSILGLNRIAFMEMGAKEPSMALSHQGDKMGKDHSKDWNLLIFQSAPGRMKRWTETEEGLKKIAKAKKSWTHAFGFLVPFQVWTQIWFKARRLATSIIMMRPILKSSVNGTAKCRFGSCLLLFCPNDKKHLGRFLKEIDAFQVRSFVDYTKYSCDEERVRTKFTKLPKVGKKSQVLWRHLPNGNHYKLLDHFDEYFNQCKRSSQWQSERKAPGYEQPEKCPGGTGKKDCWNKPVISEARKAELKELAVERKFKYAAEKKEFFSRKENKKYLKELKEILAKREKQKAKKARAKKKAAKAAGGKKAAKAGKKSKAKKSKAKKPAKKTAKKAPKTKKAPKAKANLRKRAAKKTAAKPAK